MTINTSEVLVAASPSGVWRWLVEPERVRQWQYGSELITDWQPGGAIRFRNEWDGQVFEQWGTVLEVSEPHKVRYSLFFPRPGLEDRPENYLFVTYLLERAGHGTKLSVVQEDNREPGSGGADDVADESSPNVLDVLKGLIESE
ncbi:SRPBCC family protein [Leifsonia poae]|uniref:SRPBCC family protein n=1 Tax=Leifsonia poae TaxID=110933 RepID=UPI001CBE85DF|nr:SRPBCC family protein [Leifsonia poae]